jgi:hypothetical protein
MGTRLNIEEAKFTWFENDLTVCTLYMDDEIWALPQIEVERGLSYHKLLIECETFGEAQELYETWKSDPKAPKFLPKELIDLKSEVDSWSLQINEPFDFLESHYYRDENDLYVTIGRPQLWTDSWMPQEIVELLGHTDEGWGIDYIPAEYVYRGEQEFKRIFEEYGFKVVENDSRLRSLAGY